MKKHGIIALAILLAAGLAVAQDTRTDQVTVPLSNPGKPAQVSVNTMFGAIKVTGYDGKDVLITAKPREKSLSVKAPNLVFSGGDLARIYTEAKGQYSLAVSVTEKEKQEKEKEKQAKTAGMKQVPLESSGLTAEEENNKVTVSLQSWRRAYDLELKVPFASSLELRGANLDVITIENVNGEIQANTANGDVKLLNVAGPVTVSTTNGDIEAVLSKVAPDKPMSIVSFHGDIDLTLPADAKASFRIKSTMGELYSDFDITLKALPAEPEKTTGKEGGKFRINLDRSVYGTINGGGPEFKIQNNSGDIYIRKKK